jgi:hypothetical protein
LKELDAKEVLTIFFESDYRLNLNLDYCRINLDAVEKSYSSKFVQFRMHPRNGLENEANFDRSDSLPMGTTKIR